RRGTGTTRRHTALATVALALSATAVLTACSAFGLGPGAGLRGDWGLVTGEDAAGAFDLSVGGVTMIVDGDAISGVAACNTYGGTVIGSVADVEQPLRVEQMFQTEMACVDDGVMQLEQRYLDALAAVTSARRVDADTVRLSGPNVVLEFDLLVEG
ncbi:META domain-containing protein, partial [Microcella sp.]|uniref:META domain-containing protein n=1 Tax=Microcella sp. TaxID=1913979 RepID=UPI00391DE8A6